jgi:transposase
LAKLLAMLGRWRDKALNYLPERLTNGVVEGLNKGIQGIIRRSFGFQNFGALRRRFLVELG